MDSLHRGESETFNRQHAGVDQIVTISVISNTLEENIFDLGILI